MGKVASDNGLKFEYVPMSIRDAEEALKKGDIDAIAGMTYSTEKDSWFDFSNPYFTMSDSLIIPKEKEKTINKITDVRNLHVVLENHTPVLETMLNMRNTNLTLSTNQFTGLVTLIKGRADVFIGNKWTSKYYLKHFNQEGNFVILDEVIEPADYVIAVKDGNVPLLRIINHSLTTLKAKGEVDAIINQWVTPKNQVEIARLEHFIFILVVVLTIAALILLIIYIWNQRLKKAVFVQTGELRILNEHLMDKRQELADNIAFKDQILNTIDTGIVTFDLHFTATSYNDRAVDILGLSTNKALNSQDSSLFIQLLQQFNIKRAQQNDVTGTVHLEVNENRR